MRSKLKAYYEGDGKNDPLLFEFRPGCYAPAFRFREALPTAPASEIHGVAVLPFANLSPNADDAYFSDGLTEELIHALTKFSGMRVVAWNSAMRLRGVEQDLGELRRQLNVAQALTGSVRISGSKLRVRAQFIDAATGVYLWSETFDRRMEDIFAIQEEIAQAIVRTLHVQLAEGAEPALAARARTTAASHEYYLKGRFHLHRRTADQLKRSLQYFEAAVAADPRSAVARSGVADAYTLLADYGLVAPAEGLPKAKAAAMAALELDPGLAEAYPPLAWIRSNYDWEWEDGESLYRQGIALNPGYASGRHWFGSDLLAVLGRFDEAVEQVDIALELDPLSRSRTTAAVSFRSCPPRLRCRDSGRPPDPGIRPVVLQALHHIGPRLWPARNYPEALAMLEKGRQLAGDMSNILARDGRDSGPLRQPRRGAAAARAVSRARQRRIRSGDEFRDRPSGAGRARRGVAMAREGLCPARFTARLVECSPHLR